MRPRLNAVLTVGLRLHYVQVIVFDLAKMTTPSAVCAACVPFHDRPYFTPVWLVCL